MNRKFLQITTRLAFILLQEKYHAYFPFILRVNLLEYVECERTMTKNSQISEKEWFLNYQEKWDMRYSIKGKALDNVLSRCLYMLYRKRHLSVGNKIT